MISHIPLNFYKYPKKYNQSEDIGIAIDQYLGDLILVDDCIYMQDLLSYLLQYPKYELGAKT